ncbi:N-acetylmuramoyl-L-alanine amidase [Nocardioides carbamazepini]|uniref:N-acetylmuramoyl-L-alanine amidase n=1 Tax=Nocardioides carbamazepini TaxID=2854259 RepID=UPI00214A370A|nr:N-acetylmuramoyl-L-alanine amidase [Nocardioides carbamazepini]MCR1782729.1 N-acetylmuramoyl-L-alanine amidase [Nocardioides carbamazepini]
MSPYPTEIPERTRRGRFVTLCQQALALAVVVAVLTPAARTVTMEVRPAEPGAADPGAVALQAATTPVTVPTDVVDATVTEYPLTTSPAGVSGRVALRGSVKPLADGGDEVTSDALPVAGFGTVGVTWAHGSEIAEEAITVNVRTRTGDAWSDWTAAEYHDEHGPDPASAEGQRSRPGTEAVLVGDVDEVQVQVETTADAPADLKVAVIDPGTPAATAEESPAIQTTGSGATTRSTAEVTEGAEGAEGAIAMQAATTGPPQPQIYSRAQWGAPEDASYKPKYGTVSAGFVHHTVNANDYQPEDVPAILRGIWKYHVKTRGWADIGYNFLVDRFGRIWEGRAGGVDKAVVGAHTLGYNDYSFAMSAIGNFETAQPSPEVINAYGALFAWKLSLSGVDPASPSQKVGSKYFAAISGHKDAGKTACPGKYLYAQIPAIRAIASQAQQGALLGQLNGSYIGSPNPDIVVRSEKSGRLVLHDIDKVDGTWRIAATVKTNVEAPWAKQLLRVGDWDGDGLNDIMAIRKSDKAPVLFRGMGGGNFHPAQVLPSSFRGVKMLAAVGDVTGDGLPDLVGQPKGDVMRVYPGQGLTGFQASVPATGQVAGKKLVPIGRWNKDSAPDALVRNGSALTLYSRILPGAWAPGKAMKSTASGYDWVIGLGPMATNGTNVLVLRNKATRAVYLVPKAKAKKLGTPILLKKRKKFDLAG